MKKLLLLTALLIGSQAFAAQKKNTDDFAIVFANGGTYCWVKWTPSDVARVDTRHDVDRILVERDHVQYVIYDAGILGRAKKAIEPMASGERLTAVNEHMRSFRSVQNDLSGKASELARRHGELSRQYARAMSTASNQVESKEALQLAGQIQRSLNEVYREQNTLGTLQSRLNGEYSSILKEYSDLHDWQLQSIKDADVKIRKLLDEAFDRHLVITRNP